MEYGGNDRYHITLIVVYHSIQKNPLTTGARGAGEARGATAAMPSRLPAASEADVQRGAGPGKYIRRHRTGFLESGQNFHRRTLNVERGRHLYLTVLENSYTTLMLPGKMRTATPIAAGRVSRDRAEARGELARGAVRERRARERSGRSARAGGGGARRGLAWCGGAGARSPPPRRAAARWVRRRRRRVAARPTPATPPATRARTPGTHHH